MDARIIQKLLLDMQKNKKLLEQKLKELHEKEFSSAIGGKMFELSMNGKYEVLKCQINDQIVGDKETIEDLVISVVSEVVSKINEEIKLVEQSLIPKGIF